METKQTSLSELLAQHAEPQDAELSAALGWPGGISDPILDRKTLLRQVADLRAALAQQDEPVAAVGTQSDVWRGYNGQWQAPGEPIKMVHLLRDLPTGTLLYTAPPQRLPLTEEEIDKIFKHLCNTVGASYKTMTRAVEQAHGIKE